MKLKSDYPISKPIKFAASKLPENFGSVSLEFDRTKEPQSYERIIAEDEISISARDDAGFMYGLLDLADDIRKGVELKEKKVSPYLENRGIKFNIPLDARTPSYSDASDSARNNIRHMWEMEFWHEFLDSMAQEKYNVLSLWSLSPFPSMVRIPEFPNACLEDVKVSARPFRASLSGKGIYGEDHRNNLYTVRKMTIEEKIRFWQEVMEYAADRCIRVYLFTWNVFVYGTEDSGYGITEDQNNPVTRNYVYCGTKALLETYPLLAGIGVTSGENMTFNGRDKGQDVPFSQTDIGFLAETYGQATSDYLKKHPERDFTFIHRMQMARFQEIMDAYQSYPGKFEISFKYSQAHMYSDTKPGFIRDFLAENTSGVKVWLTVRNDDYYMYRWGDPLFAKEYLLNIPKSCVTGFYMGPDGFTWGRDYMTRNSMGHELVWNKMWYMFRIWGQLSYNISLADSYFIDEIKNRFCLDQTSSEMLYEAWEESSRIIPELNCIHWHDFDFQWYPEGCCMYENPPSDKLCFANIHEFESCSAMPYTNYGSAEEYAKSLAEEKLFTKISPEKIADSIENHSLKAYEMVEKLKERCENEEFVKTLYDIEAMSWLGRYYAKKEKAAILLCLYKMTGNACHKGEAVELLSDAYGYWKIYSNMTVNAYIPQTLTRMCAKVNVQEFDDLAETDIFLAKEE